MASSAVAAVRRFNRFYTQRFGILGEGHLHSPFSLTEVRVLYELAHRDAVTAGMLVEELALDAGYLSRILRRFQLQGLLKRAPAPDDKRRAILSLTRKGRAAFGQLDEAANGEVGRVLEALPREGQQRLVEALRTAHQLLGGDPRLEERKVELRTHLPGDIGWIVERHGAVYAREYGWNAEFEALVARIGSDFLSNYDPVRERCWLATLNGERVGSVMLVNKSRTVGKLRLLLVEPEARGLGIGRLLVEACIGYARAAGYKTLTLWTNDVLHAARRIYEEAGFVRVSREASHQFGHDLVSENWELKL